MCECFNSYILKACDIPILTMLEMIWKKLMRMYQVKRDGIEKLTGKLCPKVVAKLDAIGLEEMECVATYAGGTLFEVTCPNSKQFVVDLGKKSCGCKQRELTGIPCTHVVSSILFDFENPKDYVNEYYSLKRYIKA
jgi:zinc finger SWIM domain-containing protein 3